MTPDAVMRDGTAIVAFLDSQAAVNKSAKIGVVGYCMGGPMTMQTAAAVPSRVGAGASFHGGGLVTDKPDSPHLLVPKIKRATTSVSPQTTTSDNRTRKPSLMKRSAQWIFRRRSRSIPARCMDGA